jgi:CcmD family protein
MSPLEQQDLHFLFYAYAAVFVAMFVFLVRMFRRTAELEREVRLLREEYGEVTAGLPEGHSDSSGMHG